jgi:hypothetical protein
VLRTLSDAGTRFEFECYDVGCTISLSAGWHTDALDADGCVPVPVGPGLGVTYDWEFIEKNRFRHLLFRSE